MSTLVLVLVIRTLMLNTIQSFSDDPQPGSGPIPRFVSTFRKVSLRTAPKRERMDPRILIMTTFSLG